MAARARFQTGTRAFSIKSAPPPAPRLSKFFAQTDQQPQSVAQLIPGTSAGTPTPQGAPPVDAGSAQNMQDRIPQRFDRQAHGQRRPA